MAWGPSHTRLVLEAHLRASARSGSRGGSAELMLGIDHLVFDERWSPLLIAALRGSGMSRVAPEIVLARPAGARRLAVVSPERRERFEALRRLGVHVTPPSDLGGAATYRERFAAPGRLVATLGPGAASVGAVGAYAIRCDALEAAAVLTGGALVRARPAVTGVALRGTFPVRVDGTDLRLEVARRLALAGASTGVIEFGGSGIAALGMGDRISLASFPESLGAEVVLLPSDEVTRRYLRSLGRESDWKTFPGSGRPEIEPLFVVDLGDLEPMISPLGDPGAARPVRHAAGLRVDRVVVGPEVSWEELGRMARVLAGKTIPPNCSVQIGPGSVALRESAAREGWPAIFASAGAAWGWDSRHPRRRPEVVGLCCGASASDLEDEDVRWYTASAETCATAALAGRLADPREVEGPAERGREPEGHDITLSPVVRPSAERPVEGVDADGWFPSGGALDRPLRGSVLLSAGDRIGGERIFPWGARVDLHGTDPETLAGLAFRAVDSGFAARALRHGGGFVTAGLEFGGAPHAELAALVLRWLGVHAVLARSFAGGMERHLVNAGILPLRFRDAGQARAFSAGEELELPDLPGALEVGTPVVARNLTRGIQAALGHDLGALEIVVLRSGGILAHASLGSRVNSNGAKVGVMSDRMGGR